MTVKTHEAETSPRAASERAAVELRQLASLLESGEMTLRSFEVNREDLFPDVGHPEDNKRPVLTTVTLEFL